MRAICTDHCESRNGVTNRDMCAETLIMFCYNQRSAVWNSGSCYISTVIITSHFLQWFVNLFVITYRTCVPKLYFWELRCFFRKGPRSLPIYINVSQKWNWSKGHFSSVSAYAVRFYNECKLEIGKKIDKIRNLRLLQNPSLMLIDMLNAEFEGPILILISGIRNVHNVEFVIGPVFAYMICCDAGFRKRPQIPNLLCIQKWNPAEHYFC